METLLTWMVVLLLVGPPVVIVVGGILLLVAAVVPAGPRRLRERFFCPWSRQVVTADFLVPEGAAHPSEVLACSAFPDPERVRCQKACRALAEIRWGLSRGVFPRWALTADGVVTWRNPSAPVPVGTR